MNSSLTRVLFLTIAQVFFTQIIYAQNISGSWEWSESSEDRTFHVTLSKPTSKNSQAINYDLIGKHCGVYYNGGRIDCAEETSIFLKKESDNIFTGTIQSNYSEEISEIRLVYSPETDQINWQVIKGKGQFYFPHEAILKK